MLASETKNLLLVFSGLVIFTVTTLLVLSYPTYIYQDVAGQIQTRSTSQCAPILINKRQYKIKLNGEVYPKSVQNMYNSSINFDCLNTRSNSTVRKRLILAWNNLFGANYYKNGFRKAGCPVTNCELTSDRSRLNEAELVLSHMREISGENNLPKARPKSQRWVFVLLESPAHGSVGNYSSYNGFFNLTATYRLDSDFSHYYDSGMVWQDNSQNFDKNRDFFSDKLKEVAAVVSNCRAKNRRLEIVKQLNESIQVDLFGKCGEKCPEKFSDGKVADCKQVLGREYKFYLAFENSFCKDYITEKFHGILRYDIIPVVFGSGEYERFIPKSGFINFKDYKTIEELAKYLVYLSSNRTAYNSYFEWKEHVVFKRPLGFSPICNMCISLHLEDYFGVREQVIDDIGSQWSPEKNCNAN